MTDPTAAPTTPPGDRPPRPPPVFSALRAEGPIPDTFFDPLPEDELQAWAGDPPRATRLTGRPPTRAGRTRALRGAPSLPVTRADEPAGARPDPREDLTVDDSGGNVFADMGLPDAEAWLEKAELARALRARLEAVTRERGWSPADAAAQLGLSAPELTDLTRGALAGFDLGRIATCLNALGADVRIVVAPAAEARARGHTRAYTRVEPPGSDIPEGDTPEGDGSSRRDPGFDPVVEARRATRDARFAEAGDDRQVFGRQVRASEAPPTSTEETQA